MADITAPERLDRRVLIGRFSRYRDAKRTVDTLAVGRIPQKRITVLGRGLSWSPPLTAERAARLGAWLGLAAGAATMLLLWSLGSLAASFGWVGAVLAGAFVGGAIGGALGLVVWRTSRERGVIPETGNVEVRRYEVLVEPEDLPRARELLER
jgi:hypothetical protein